MTPCSQFVCDYPFDCARFYKDPGHYDHGIERCEGCSLFSCKDCSVTIQCSVKNGGEEDE